MFVGLVSDEKVVPLTQIFGVPPSPDPGNMLCYLEMWDAVWLALKAFAENPGARKGLAWISLGELDVLPPVRPRQIVCVGANYRKHVIELMLGRSGGATFLTDERRRDAERLMDHRAASGAPFAFIKPVSTLLDPFGDIVIPADSGQTDWELELTAVIGKPAYRVQREQAFECVAGYTIANDISARDRLQRPDAPALGFDWIAGKSAPGFLPLGPFIVPRDLIADPQSLRMTLTLNRKVMQNECTADMIFPVDRIIEHVSTYMRLLPGDVICTGSPAGNGVHHGRFLQPGDIVEGRIEGLGSLRNRCVAEELGPGAPLHRPFAPLPEPSR